MRSQVINWVTPYLEIIMPYLERWDKLTTTEYGIIAACAFGMIVLAIILWKVYRVVEGYLYRRYQLLGWQENRGKSV